MFGGTDQDRASTVINCLGTVSIDKVMPHLPENWWTYTQAKTAILEQFGNADTIITLKTKFLAIEIKQDEPYLFW